MKYVFIIIGIVVGLNAIVIGILSLLAWSAEEWNENSKAMEENGYPND